MLPEYAQARKAMWDAINPHTGMRRIDEAFPHDIRSATNQQEMKISLKCGSMWQLVGSDNFNALVGSPPIGIVHSEHAIADPRAAGYLRPIIAENNGWSLFIYTSRGYNHGFSTYQNALGTAGAFAQRLTVDDTDVFTGESIETERNWYASEYGQHDGDALFRQEYYCDFSAANIGAILGRYVEQAEKEGRINDEVQVDESAPIYISSDIGFRDTATWWFWQPRRKGFALIDYDEDSGMDADDWIPRLHAKGYEIAKVYLPHDARVKTFQSKHSAVEAFLKAFGEKRVEIVPQSKKLDQINAARRVIRICEFHRTRCKEGLNGLRSWSFKYDQEKKAFSKDPEHDWASHPGDGFAYGAQVMGELPPPKPSPEEPRGLMVGPQNRVTLEEMWKTPRHQERRI